MSDTWLAAQAAPVTTGDVAKQALDFSTSALQQIQEARDARHVLAAGLALSIVWIGFLTWQLLKATKVSAEEDGKRKGAVSEIITYETNAHAQLMTKLVENASNLAEARKQLDKIADENTAFRERVVAAIEKRAGA